MGNETSLRKREASAPATLSPTLLKTGWRYLLRHPWQSVLMIVGIILGVAVAVAIDVANVSASRAFDLSTEAVTGRATHDIIGGPQGLDEGLYTRLRLAGIEAAAPVVTDYITSPQLGDQVLQLLGVDPFAESPFRDYLGFRGQSAQQRSSESTQISTQDLVTFFTQPGAVLISTDLAQQYHLTACEDPTSPIPGCQLSLELDGVSHPAFIAGLIQPSASDPLSRRALDGIVIADIATAQELTGRLRRLDRIDLILPANCSDTGPASPATSQCPEAAQIKALLPSGSILEPVAARTGTVAEMTAAFRLNLTALSLLALVVGMFLIYNTMTFSVIQRRQLFGILRCLGVTSSEVFTLVVGEALVASLVGTTLGLILGVTLGQGAVRLVTQTINDLYFAVTVSGVQIPTSSLIKGILLGVIATILAASLPAAEAASVPPRMALSRATLERKAGKAVNLAAVGGAALLLLGSIALILPTDNLLISFSGTFTVIIGFAALAPTITRLLMKGLVPILGRLWGVMGRMAPRGVNNALSRTSIAIAALMVAVSVSIGVSLMVSSFRHTVIVWLDQTLQGDIYISAPSLTANQSSEPLDLRVISLARAAQGVARTDVLRSVSVDSPQGPIHIAATDNRTVAFERMFLSELGSSADVQAALNSGAILVSEPLANRLRLPRNGGGVTLFTASGAHAFQIAGIYYDYSSSQGSILMTLDTYRHWWQDQDVTAMALRLNPGVDPEKLAISLRSMFSPLQHLLVRPNQALKHDVLVVFDRTFAITGALQLLATLVAFIGVLSALLSLQLERQRELGILRAIGLTTRQLWALVMGETGLMGLVAGMLSIPTGFVLALILIYIINLRSFGWTLQMQVLPWPFLQALIVSISAALLAGIYPAYRASRIVAAEAMRFE